MKTFLSQTAAHYAGDAERLAKTCFVFPNHRSALHFRKEVKEATGLEKAPCKTVSINDFFQKIYGVETTDRIRLVLALYECYRELNPKAEPLDEFIHWGNIMVSDFDNVDKYLVDASKVFVNVADFRTIQDTYDYLTENQRKAIEHFIAHFKDERGHITVNMNTESRDIKARFLSVWNLLSPLYQRFNEKLSAEGLAYEGKIYRACARSIKEGADVTALLRKHFPGRERYVFVGLNALNECEKTMLRAMRDAGVAEFVWDFSSKEIRDPRNRASFFLRKNLEEFPQAFPLDSDGLTRPSVKVVSVPSSIGQTKLAPKILETCAGSKPEETAFILPDETLLMPLVSAIPGEYDTVNITMGYPMAKSGIYSFLKAVSSLHLSFRRKDGVFHFYHKAVFQVLSSGIFRSILTPEDKEVIEKVKKEAKQYIPMNELHGTPLLDTVFTPVALGEGSVHDLNAEPVLDPGTASAAQNLALACALKNILRLVTGKMAALVESDAQLSIHADMEMEFAERCIKALEAISSIGLEVKPATWLRLLDGLLRQENVPFEGDALEGLQVMGTLETRALDFRNIAILSCNEDLFPHRSVDNSFIPPELRKGFGLPTTEYQNAVWAYYFYRLLQRAENVWLIYDSRTEGLLSGEESRYVKQLEYQFRFPLEKMTAVAPVKPLAEDESIPKTEKDIAALKNGHLSASTLQSYLYCPAKFYYQAVKRLKTEDDVTESMDAASLGTIFHAVMEALYKDKTLVTPDFLRQTLADNTSLKNIIDGAIRSEMKALDVEGRNLVISEVLLEYVRAALKHDLRLLSESGSQGFRILGLERYMQKEIDGYKFIGFIDRIDSYKNGEIRIVDYKTGHIENEDILISDSNAEAVTEKLFGESNTGRPKIALQLYLYDQFAHSGILRPGEKAVNSIYSTARLLTSPLPDVEESPVFSATVGEKLHGVLSEISDTSIPFRRTKDKHVCEMCDFRSICGR